MRRLIHGSIRATSTEPESRAKRLLREIAARGGQVTHRQARRMVSEGFVPRRLLDTVIAVLEAAIARNEAECQRLRDELGTLHGLGTGVVAAAPRDVRAGHDVDSAPIQDVASESR